MGLGAGVECRRCGRGCRMSSHHESVGERQGRQPVPSSSKAAIIHAADATTPLLTFRLHLQNASRVNPASPSRKELRRMIDDPDFLDVLEEALRGVR